VGLRDWDGTYSLFPLRAEPALSLEQMKIEIFDSVLVIWSFFLETLYPASHKKERKGISLPYSPPELVQPAGSQLST
jgi:hypothetical protein